MPARSLSSTPTAEGAISAALGQNWKEAVLINNELVKNDTTDIDALNRLGFAYLKLGQITQAKRTFEKVLKLDSYNQIALKNSKRLATLKRKDIAHSSLGEISPLLFLEEPGKTKIVSLVNPAPSHVLLTLSSGQQVALKPRNHGVEIRTEKNIYLGVLPDDLSYKLLRFLDSGNRYQTHIKSVGKNSLIVIIREVERGKRFADQPTFTPSRTILPMSRSRGDGDVPDVTPTGEEEGEGAQDFQGTNRDS